MKRSLLSTLSVAIFCIALIGCGFHARGEWHLSPPLQKMYLETNDPYGQLSRELTQQLKASNMLFAQHRNDATVVLRIEQDSTSQDLLSLNATQQTRQYKLTLTIRFSLQDINGVVILPTQIVQDSRIITIQSNQILGSSNEITLMTKQMHQGLANTMLNRLESPEVARLIDQYFNQIKIKKL